MRYEVPVQEILFVMQHIASFDQVTQLEQFRPAELDIEMAQAIIEESAKFFEDVVSPLNWVGDQQPAILKDGQVITTPGFKAAFDQFTAGGYQGLMHPVKFGGQGLPKVMNTAIQEMMHSANLSFSLCPMLTDGAIEALLTAANPMLQERYLPQMISGKWTGTMNLTEPQSGSDLSLVRTRAQPSSDGNYRIFGTKVYITYGDHDFTENIIHLVLARTPDAPAGIKGISLLMVPKFLVNEDGSLGKQNDVQCISLEHKLGIKASPTAVLQFGDQDGAIGYLIGEENRGLEYMFIMMNAARFQVGMQGIGLSERAYQKAVSYAKDRLQSRDLEGSEGPVAIINHPDIKRMLMTMRAKTEGARALAYLGAARFDLGEYATDPLIKKAHLSFYEFLIPIIKAFSTENAVDIASLGIQVHGGMGFIEETGAAQYYRDARILPIYEGTTAIQANDLIGRKTARDGGAVARSITRDILKTEQALANSASFAAKSMLRHLTSARLSFEQAIEFVTTHMTPEIKNVFAGSVPYLMMSGYTLAGWQMANALLKAEEHMAEDPSFYSAKVATAHFFAEHLLNQVPSMVSSIVEGGASVNALTQDQF